MLGKLYLTGQSVQPDQVQLLLNGAAAANYEIDTGSSDFTVDVTITKSDDAEITYDPNTGITPFTGNPIDSLIYKPTVTGVNNETDTAVGTVSYSYQYKADESSSWGSPSTELGNISAVGIYQITATLEGGDNYETPTSNTAVFTLTVTGAGFTIEGHDPAPTVTYKGDDYSLAELTKLNEHTIRSSSGQTLSNLQVTFAPKRAETDGSQANWSNPVTSVRNVADTGAYWYRITADNHVDTYGTVTVTIEPAEFHITETLSGETKIYDGDDSFDGTITPTFALTKGERGCDYRRRCQRRLRK